MKKVLAIVSLFILLISLFQFTPLNAHAKTKTFTKSFAQKVKSGTLPNSKGKIGMTYSKLKKVEKGSLQEDLHDDKIMVYYGKYSEYRFPNTFGSYKIQSMSQSFEHAYSLKSFQKYFGKPYKARDSSNTYSNSGVYKAGKYYVFFDTRNTWGGTSYISVGTKSMILKTTGYTNIYR